jgi:hypothetical protein
LLAAPASDQLAAFPEYVCKPDEIALLFTDCLCFLPELIQAGIVKGPEATLLREIDDCLSEMTAKGAGMWTESAVRHDAEWESIREHASRVLEHMNEAKRPPRLDWIRFHSN